MPAVIEIAPDIARRGSTVVVGFTASIPHQSPIKATFEIEDGREPKAKSVNEAMLIASLALAMHRRSTLRMRGPVSRSVRHTIDLYQEVVAGWWPERYQKVGIEVDVVDDEVPVSPRGILCFSGGLDSVFSARQLGQASQIDTGLFIAGYDIDIPNTGALQHERSRVERLLKQLDLAMVAIRSDVRQELGQAVIEGAQGTYLAAALTLLSDSYGHGYVSSSQLDLADLGISDPVHEATMSLLGSTRFPIGVYGGQVRRIRKLQLLFGDTEIFRDIRVCQGRSNDAHCGRCYKCISSALACVAVNGEWPPWLPEHDVDLGGLRDIEPEEWQVQHARAVLQAAVANGVTGGWTQTLSKWADREQSKLERARMRAYWRSRLLPFRR